MHNYWTAYGLAERGHELYVVTNADEVEAEYRLHLGQEDQAMMEPVFAASGGRVKLFMPERTSDARMKHIPTGPMFVTKLASLATQVIRQCGCDLIYAYYFEPYAVAGHLAAAWTGCPLVVRNAGSDLERLMRMPDLGTSYKEILKSAGGVLAGGKKIADRYVGMGVAPERIYSPAVFSVPTMVFNPDAPPLDQKTLAAWGGFQLNDHDSIPDLTKPTLGIYGKVGQFKGSFDLVSALACLKDEGLDFNFLAMTDGREFEQFKAAIEEHDLADRTWLLPFQPHWQVPRFIRACTAVCFLERDFPIAIHTPTIPREILACGTCLILSKEIADKQFYQDELIDQENLLVVSDPKDHQDLAEALRCVIQNPDRAGRIGNKGHLISEQIEDFPEYARQMEALFQRLAGQPSSYQSFAELDEAEFKAKVNEEAVSGSASPAGQAIHQVMPWLRFLIPKQFETLLARFEAQHACLSSNYFELAYDFCRFLESRWAAQQLYSDAPAFESILRHQRAWLSVSFDNGVGGGRPFAGVNQLYQRQLTWEAIHDLKPLKSCRTHLEKLDYDVISFFTQPLENDQGNISGQAVTELVASLEKQPTLVLFHKTPNLISREIKVNRTAMELLDLCNGTRATNVICEMLARRLGLRTDQELAGLRTNLLAALQQLYRDGIIIFC
ncbi:MAG: glycosyltransferase [Anaerolineae bacterium]|nr:glycosyltransferase [Anaerolineae bacterium]